MQEDHIIVLNINEKPIELGNELLAYYVYIKDEEGLRLWRNAPDAQWYPELDIGIWVYDGLFTYTALSEKINQELKTLNRLNKIQTILTTYKNSVE